MKKAYKVFKNNWTCRNYDYKRNGNVIGEIYEMDGEIEICKRGFHYCLKMVDCFNYYGFNNTNKVAEIEILGDIKNNGGDKEVTNKFKILKELSWHDVLDLVNIGTGNTGNRNSGDGNSGDGNSGDGNSGDGNSGNRNSGNRNSGDGNSGDGNSGNRNSGDGNSGNWNSGDGNSGYLNTITPDTILVFNKECSREIWNKAIKPDFMYFNVLNKFIYTCDMTDEEKENNPDYETLGGYLRKMTYKEAWKYSWNNANKENRKLLLNLPNFDNEIFKEITGIDVQKEIKEE
ncbi:MAG: pentapeptide repeat-containing protein [Fusobacteriales bacterium]|nr:pentapeptide repeat-containing protein [Fusobacteriales bacterium]